MTVTVDELVSEARRRLAAAPFQPPGREALLFVGRILGWSEARVMARGDEPVPEAAERRFRELLERRLAGEPVAYLFGEREFYGRPFRVDRRVLIPRPETEHVVEAALAATLPPRPRILDVGTGSGCIAITLALELPAARVVATDLDPAVLELGRDNARRLGARVDWVAADLAAGLDPGRFDMVVSNPPYLGREEADALSPEVREYEPHLALFAPGRGDAVVERLLELGRNLHPGAAMAMEIGLGQLDRILARAAELPLSVARILDDYAGIPRVVVFTRNGEASASP